MKLFLPDFSSFFLLTYAIAVESSKKSQFFIRSKLGIYGRTLNFESSSIFDCSRICLLQIYCSGFVYDASADSAQTCKIIRFVEGTDPAIVQTIYLNISPSYNGKYWPIFLKDKALIDPDMEITWNDALGYCNNLGFKMVGSPEWAVDRNRLGIYMSVYIDLKVPATVTAPPPADLTTISYTSVANEIYMDKFDNIVIDGSYGAEELCSVMLLFDLHLIPCDQEIHSISAVVCEY